MKKRCPKCGIEKDFSEFSKNKGSKDGLNNWCKECFKLYQKDEPERWRFYRANRKALQLDRTPIWANIEIIKEIYTNCPKGYQVDHIIPLNSKAVSGLHVESNLQYLTEKENQVKHNKFRDGSSTVAALVF